MNDKSTLSLDDALASGRYEFLDLGSGSGGSIQHCAERFGLSPGLGLEFDRGLVEEGRRSGYDIVHADVTKVDVPDRCVRFVSMMDFLEHLPDAETAVSVLARFRNAPREFIFIRHPSFDDIDYLASKGLKLCWTDWTGHPNMMTLEDLKRAFAELGLTDYVIIPQHRILDSSHDQVVALDARPDIVEYDARLDGPKPFVEFDRPVYTRFDIFVRCNPAMDCAAWDAIVASDPGAEISSRHVDSATERAPRLPGAMQLGLFSVAEGRWFLCMPDNDHAVAVSVYYGAGGRSFVPLVGDFDGDGQDGIGVYDPEHRDFFLKNFAREGEADHAFKFGPLGAWPVVGDWNGSGADTIGVYDRSTGRWHLRTENSDGPADVEHTFGAEASTAVPVTGDWDGDGADSIGFFDPETASWTLLPSLGADSPEVCFSFGAPGALPVVGDWDGDGRDSIGVYLPDTGTWMLRNSNSAGPPDVTIVFRLPEGTPVSGAWFRRM